MPRCAAACARAPSWTAFIVLLSCSVALVLLLSPLKLYAPDQSRMPASFLMLSNDRYKVGFDLTRGAGFFYLSAANSSINVISDFDEGRLIQQSYYGATDNTTWEGMEWRFNPVQGGAEDGSPSQLHNLTATPTTVTSTVTPRNWAGAQLLREVRMTSRASLHERYVHLHMAMAYDGDGVHPELEQELPAVFLRRRFARLATYSGGAPWSGEPVQYSLPETWWSTSDVRHSKYELSERWAAYEDPASGQAVGILSPAATHMVAYRVGLRDSETDPFACSYLAPVASLAVQPRSTFEYDVYVATGAVLELRELFGSILRNSTRDGAAQRGQAERPGGRQPVARQASDTDAAAQAVAQQQGVERRREAEGEEGALAAVAGPGAQRSVRKRHQRMRQRRAARQRASVPGGDAARVEREAGGQAPHGAVGEQGGRRVALERTPSRESKSLRSLNILDR